MAPRRRGHSAHQQSSLRHQARSPRRRRGYCRQSAYRRYRLHRKLSRTFQPALLPLLLRSCEPARWLRLLSLLRNHGHRGLGRCHRRPAPSGCSSHSHGNLRARLLLPLRQTYRSRLATFPCFPVGVQHRWPASLSGRLHLLLHRRSLRSPRHQAALSLHHSRSFRRPVGIALGRQPHANP